MKYVLGIFGFIILTIIAVVLLASTTSNRTDNQEGERVVNLVDYADGAIVTHTTRGEITGHEDYREVRISVSPSERRAQVVSGYTGSIERQQTFANNSQAFDTFIRALSQAGFSRERETENTDMRGVCPLGRRYIYQLHDEGREVVNLWSTSCSNRHGTFGGDDSLVRQLFEGQIPNFNDFSRGVRL